MSILLIAVESLEWTEKVQVHQPAWLFITLFVLLGFLAGIRIYYGSILMPTLKSSVSFQVAARIFKDNSGLQKQQDNSLYTFYIFSAGLIIYMAEIRSGLDPYGLSGGLLYLFNLALVAALFLGRLVIMNVAGFLFNKIGIFREYLYNTFIFNKIIGILLLPLSLFVFYTNGVLMEMFQWIAMAALFLILILRLIRGFIFSFKRGVSIFYMFLYLCALEMAPLILLYRWLEGIL